MLMLLLCIFFSTISTAMMSYLAMNTQLGPWVAPVFVVVCMAFVIPFVKNKWFYEHAIVTIAAGSAGGMIGICLGLAFPSMYFLHQSLLQVWLADPFMICTIVFIFVLCAAWYAFLLTYFLRWYFLQAPGARFPMSQLVYQVIDVDIAQKSRRLILSGFCVASAWNATVIALGSSVMAYASPLHMFPLLMSVGFVAGKVIALPTFLGLITRVVALDVIKSFLHTTASQQQMLITFCLGMLIVLFVRLIIETVRHRRTALIRQGHAFMFKKFTEPKFAAVYAGCMVVSAAYLKFWGVEWLSILCTWILIGWLSRYMIELIAWVGIVEIDAYVWVLLLPVLYTLGPTSLASVVIAIFATLTLGLVVDMMFSYKLADLANISYAKIVRYQMIAIFCAAIAGGLFLYGYAQLKGIDAFGFAPKAYELEQIINFGKYDFRVLCAGMMFALLVLLLTSELLVVIGAALMTPFMASVLVLAGVLAHLIKKPEHWYPLWFGVYAGHMLWLIIDLLW
jgi:hypothetical protein